MEGTHWILMVCTWSTSEIKIILQAWDRLGAESVNSESSGYHDDNIDIVDWNELRPT